MAMPDDGTWRTSAFRQNMVSKIEEAILHCGAPTSKNAAEMENQVFSKANSKNEYLSFVARLIIHIKEMGSRSRMGQQGGQQQNQLAPGPGQMGGPMGGGQPNMMMGQMSPMNQMGANVNVMNSQGMQQPQQGMQQQINMQSGMSQQAPGGMNIPQQTQSQQNPNQQAGLQMGQQPPMQQQQSPMMNSNFMNQAQIQQQQQQQMHNQGMNPGQMQNPGGVMGNPQMQQMQNPQMQQQMQNAQMQQQMMQQQVNQQNPGQNPNMPNPQQQQMMQVRAMSPQTVGGRMMGPQSTMANQLSHMANQRKVGLPNRPMGSNAMGIPRPEHGPNYGINRLNYYGANNLAQQVENVGMGNQYPGIPGGSPLQRPGGQFIPPNVNQVNMNMGPTPSPNSMNISGSSIQNQSGFAHSPQPPPTVMHGSPGPGGLRTFPCKDGYLSTAVALKR